MPLDIFVPFWGPPELLRETVRSVLEQRSGDWKLTVVDDAYPDETVSQFFAELDDPRVTYLRNSVNQGITENYRTCVAQATEDLVVILGCDDVLLPNYVDVVLDAYRAFPQVDIIQPGVRIIDENGTVVSTLVDTVKHRLTMSRDRAPQVLSGESLAVSLLRANWLYWPSLAFRREVLQSTPFRDGLPVIQDLALVIDIVCAGGRLLLEPTVCFWYRRHLASASSAKALDGSRFRDERYYFHQAESQVLALGWRRARRAARGHVTSRLYALRLLPQAVVSRRRGTVRTLLRHAFRPGTA
jgi:glycosyltransferase involved in cell wall biosynthesis